MYKIENDQFRTIGIDEGVLAWVDHETNLMWEVKKPDNAMTVYVWHSRYIDSLQTKDRNGEDLPYDSEIKDAASYVKEFNKLKYAGFDDWRLPTKEELESLIDHTGDFRKIKKPLQGNCCAAYWSDTPTMLVNVYKLSGSDIRDTAHIPAIKIVDFSTPMTGDYKPENSLWVRCVRTVKNSHKNTFELD